MSATECRCALIGRTACPQHLEVWKLRYADGTFAVAGLNGYGSRNRHGKPTAGKTWSQRGHLKAALTYQYPDWYAGTQDARGWTVLQITGAHGVVEYTLKEFRELL